MRTYRMVPGGPRALLRAENTRRGRTSQRRLQLHLEALEDRQLLSITPAGDPFAVSTSASGISGTPAIAEDVAGDFVVVWQNNGGDGSGLGIFARRYDASGAAVSDPFQVNTFTTGDQSNPSVAMDATGDFVVTWQSAGQDGAGLGVFGQLYSATGAKVGGEFQVNTTTAGDQFYPAVAMDGVGNFAVTWVNASPNQPNVGIQRFNSVGMPLGSELLFTDFSTSESSLPAIAMNSGGDIVVAGSQVHRFAADGTPKASPTDTGLGFYPAYGTRVVMDAAGNFVVGAENGAPQVRLQRFNADGIAQGSMIDASPPDRGNYFGLRFDLGMDQAGNFLVVANDSSSSQGVVRQYRADGTVATATTQINPTSHINGQSRIGMDGRGDFTIVWAAGTQAQRFINTPLMQIGAVTTSLGEDIVEGGTPVTETRGFTVKFLQAASIEGGNTGAHSVTNPANWQLFAGAIDISSQITSITYGSGQAHLTLASPLRTGSYRLIARQSIQGDDGSALDGDRDGTAGGDFVRTFQVNALYPVGDQFQVSPVGYYYTKPIIASNASGAWVSVWVTNNQPGILYSNDYTIHAQRYDAAGESLGSPIIVGTLGGFAFYAPIAAVMDGAGNFVIVWSSGKGISIQRFTAAGLALGDPLQIAKGFGAPAVAMTPDGGFLVAYYLQDAVVQRYSADGSVQGSPLALFAALPNTYFDIRQQIGLAVDAAGNFVAAAPRSSPDNRVLASRFNAAGVPLQFTFLVTPQIADMRSPFPSVAMDAAGDFVIAWEYTSANSPVRTMARRYNSAGLPMGAPFDVDPAPNLPISSFGRPQAAPPAVAMDPQGNFVIAWENHDLSLPIQSPYGIAARGFFANGAPMGDSVRVNTNPDGDQLAPTIMIDANDHVLIAWAGPGIQAQRFGLHAPPLLDLNGPAVGIDYSASYVSTGGPVPIVDSAHLTITDPSASQLTSATVSIANPQPGDVLAANTAGTQITAAYAGGVLSLTGIDTLANYQQVLRSVTFDATLVRPTSSTVDVSFVINDGLVASPTAHSSISTYAAGSSLISGRYLFYGDSIYDQNLNYVIFIEDGAIAPDKSAYLGGGTTATFANVSSYSQGINGIMIDLAGRHGVLDAGDFAFAIGNNNSPDTWTAAPAPAFVVTRAGAGVGGSDRVVLIWTDGAIKNTWLEIIVLANGHTGLATPDTFFYASAVGDTGLGDTTTAKTDVFDELAVRGHSVYADGITNIYDFNRDRGYFSGYPDSLFESDELVARHNATSNLNAPKFLKIGPSPIVLAQAIPSSPSFAGPASVGGISISQEDASDTGLAFSLAVAGSRPPLAASFAGNDAGYLDDQLVELLASGRRGDGRKR